MTRNAVSSAKSPRALEIDELVYFIRTSDLLNARRSIVNIVGRGETISREILVAYHQLESDR